MRRQTIIDRNDALFPYPTHFLSAGMAVGRKTVGIVSGDDGKAITERHKPADEVMNLPGDYRKVTSETPILGAPLPGDLGGPILERQRQLGLEPGSTTGIDRKSVV